MQQLKRIGILAGKFKPPHRGHFSVISKIANHTDETHVFVSPVGMDGISGEMSRAILTEYFKNDETVKIHLASGSPVKAAYELISELGSSPDASTKKVSVYALPEDQDRFKSIAKFAGDLAKAETVGTTRTDSISGTKMREAIRNGDKEFFKKGIPSNIDSEKIWRIVKEEASGTYAIPANSFTAATNTNPNVQPSTISAGMGGIPNHWTNSQPISRWDFMTTQVTPVSEEQSTNRTVKTFNEFIAGDENK